MISDQRFKSSIDTLTAIIEASIKRRQYANAEKYINYFFEPVYACFAKRKYAFKTEEKRTKGMFRKLTIENDFDGFPESKIFDLMNFQVSGEYWKVYTVV